MPQYCLVKHRISTYVIDGADADRNPDRIPVTGVVTFEALLDKGDSVVVTEDGVATTITLAPIEARITNGELWHRGEEGVKLFAGGPDTNPERIRYRAKFTNLIAGGKKIELKPILFEAVPGGELTLSMAQPVPGKPYPGYSATIEAGLSQIEGARDEALGQVSGAVAAEVDAIKWVRRLLLDEHLDTITQPGTYGVTQPLYTTTANGYPRSGRATLVLTPTNPTNPNTYQQELTYADGEKWTRERFGASTWSSWSSPTNELKTTTVKLRGALTAEMDLDSLRYEEHSGWWRCLSTPIAESLGLPDPGRGHLTVKWVSGLGQSIVSQEWVSLTTGVTWTRVNNATGWSAWADGPPSEIAAPTTSETRREQLIQSRGGRIGTGGRGVVALRFDHNVRPFQEKVLPLLRERGLPASMCHFVDEMAPQPGYSGSDEVGMTWADVGAQFFQGIEVWSHSWSHTDASTPEQLVREIVESRTALESAIPEASVVGWMQPGLVGTGYMGYRDVYSTPELHGTTLAGSLIEATYGADNRGGAVITPLGSRHFGGLTLDSASSPLATKNVIDEVARTATGVVLNLHPSRVDAAGGISTATFVDILDHIVSLRDQEKIVVLSVGGMTVADPESVSRQVLTPALSSWAGWTTTPDGGKSGTPSSGTLSTSFPLGNHPYLQGHLRELAVTATGTGTITMRVVDRTGVSALDVSRTVEVGGGITTHLPFGIARTNNGLRVEITCTTGSVTIHDARIQSV